MASPISRELSITYGGFVVGGDQTSRILREWHMVDTKYDTCIVEYRFTMKQATAAAMAQEIQAAESAFRTPFQNFTVLQAGSTFKSLSHSGSTGFNGNPSIVKRGEKTDTGRSRTYTVRVEFGMPADVSGSSNRRVTATKINVDYSPARVRTLTVSGEYTAGGGASARSNYETALTTYAASITSDLGGTWKKLQEPTSEADDANKVIRFSVQFEEIIFTGIGASNANVRRERVTISFGKTAPGDSPSASVRRLATLNVKYDCYLDATASTNLTSLYSSLRSSIISQVSSILGSGTLAVIEDTPDYDPTTNHLTVSLVCLGTTGSNTLELTVTTEYDTQFGNELVPVWNGDPKARYIYQGPRTETKTITTVKRVLGTLAPPIDEPKTIVGTPWVLKSINKSTISERLGIPPNIMDTTRQTIVEKYEWANKVKTTPTGVAT